MTDLVSNTGPGGAELAFERLYSEHHRAVLGYCSRRVPRADAWDAASEVFIVAWRKLDNVPDGAEARAWLLGVAYRVLANHRRGTQRRGKLVERVSQLGAGSPSSPEEQLIRSEAGLEVIDALARLKPKDREVLQLATWEELAPAEIAEVLGISRDAVDQRYSRAKRRLARELEGRPTFKRRATQAESEKGGVA